MMKCPVCDGEGGFSQNFGEGTSVYDECGYCLGAGEISVFEWLSYHFWRIVPDWWWDIAYDVHHLFHKESEE